MSEIDTPLKTELSIECFSFTVAEVVTNFILIFFNPRKRLVIVPMSSITDDIFTSVLLPLLTNLLYKILLKSKTIVFSQAIELLLDFFKDQCVDKDEDNNIKKIERDKNNNIMKIIVSKTDHATFLSNIDPRDDYLDMQCNTLRKKLCEFSDKMSHKTKIFDSKTLTPYDYEKIYCLIKDYNYYVYYEIDGISYTIFKIDEIETKRTVFMRSCSSKSINIDWDEFISETRERHIYYLYNPEYEKNCNQDDESSDWDDQDDESSHWDDDRIRRISRVHTNQGNEGSCALHSISKVITRFIKILFGSFFINQDERCWELYETTNDFQERFMKMNECRSELLAALLFNLIYRIIYNKYYSPSGISDVIPLIQYVFDFFDMLCNMPLEEEIKTIIAILKLEKYFVKRREIVFIGFLNIIKQLLSIIIVLKELLIKKIISLKIIEINRFNKTKSNINQLVNILKEGYYASFAVFTFLGMSFSGMRIVGHVLTIVGVHIDGDNIRFRIKNSHGMYVGYRHYIDKNGYLAISIKNITNIGEIVYLNPNLDLKGFKSKQDFNSYIKLRVEMFVSLMKSDPDLIPSEIVPPSEIVLPSEIVPRPNFLTRTRRWLGFGGKRSKRNRKYSTRKQHSKRKRRYSRKHLKYSAK
jgi:hypothetical protein